MRRALLVIAALAAAMFAGAMTPGHAATDSKSDPRGDAPRQVDITRFSVTNGDHRVAMRIKVRDLRKRGTFSVYYWGGTAATPPARSAIVQTRLVDGERVVRYYACDSQECERVRCRGMRLDWRPGDDLVVMSTRQACFPRPRRNPDAPAPAVGRFFAYGEFSEDVDDLGDPLTVQRG